MSGILVNLAKIKAASHKIESMFIKNLRYVHMSINDIDYLHNHRIDYDSECLKVYITTNINSDSDSDNMIGLIADTYLINFALENNCRIIITISMISKADSKSSNFTFIDHGIYPSDVILYSIYTIMSKFSHFQSKELTKIIFSTVVEPNFSESIDLIEDKNDENPSSKYHRNKIKNHTSRTSTTFYQSKFHDEELYNKANHANIDTVPFSNLVRRIVKTFDQKNDYICMEYGNLDEIIGERFTFGDSGDATYYLFEWSALCYTDAKLMLNNKFKKNDHRDDYEQYKLAYLQMLEKLRNVVEKKSPSLNTTLKSLKEVAVRHTLLKEYNPHNIEEINEIRNIEQAVKQFLVNYKDKYYYDNGDDFEMFSQREPHKNSIKGKNENKAIDQLLRILSNPFCDRNNVPPVNISATSPLYDIMKEELHNKTMINSNTTNTCPISIYQLFKMVHINII
jgi:hypothetical protein